MKFYKLLPIFAIACVLTAHAEDKWATKWDAPWTKGLNWIGPNTYLWFDPITKRNIEVTTSRGIDGCDAGLVLFETGYVCKSLIPPPPPKPPKPQPIYPPAGTVCKPDYPKPEFEDCAPGYKSGNTGTHDGDTWCKMTAAQKALCTVIYPPALPDPGPGHDFGRQIGYMGPDGILRETKDPNSAPCGGCANGGPTDDPKDDKPTETSPETPSQPGDGTEGTDNSSD